jgi:hypothetical protein
MWEDYWKFRFAFGNFWLPNKYIIVERTQQSKQRNFEEKNLQKCPQYHMASKLHKS